MPSEPIAARPLALAIRWWPAWVALNAVVFALALRRQLEVIDEPCSRCVTVFRLDTEQQRALVDAGGSLGEYRALVAGVIVAFGLIAGWLAWMLVRRSRPQVAPVTIGFLFVSVAAIRWTEDAATLDTGWLSPLARIVLIANATAIPILFAIFPDGRWRPRWSRPAVVAFGAWYAGVYLSPLADEVAYGRDPVAGIDALVFLSSLVASFGWQVARYRTSDEGDRRAIRSVVVVLAVVLVVFVPLVVGVRASGDGDPRWHVLRVAFAIAALALLLGAIALAVVREHLWDIDVAVSRAIVYGGLTLSVLMAYGVVVAVVSRSASVEVPPGSVRLRP